MPVGKTKPATVLYVEDDWDDYELTLRAFKDDNVKVDLRHVEDGEKALDYLLRRGEFADEESSPTPDLILLDLNLPRVDGREVLQELRGVDRLRKIPVIILTTSDQESDVNRMYQVGCNSYVTKPIDANKFIDTVRLLRNYWLELVTIPMAC